MKIIYMKKILISATIIIALAALCGCANDAGANKPGADKPGASGQNNESDEIVETGELIEFRCYPGYSDMNGGYHGECLKKDDGGAWIIESSNKESIEDPEITTVYSVDAKSEQEFEAFLKEKNVASLKNRMDSEDFATDYSPWGYNIVFTDPSAEGKKRLIVSFNQYKQYSDEDYELIDELWKRFEALKGEVLSETVRSDDDEPDWLPDPAKDEAEAEIEKLLATGPVHPQNATVLKAMADCATCAGAVRKGGALPKELDNDSRSRLRYRFLEAVMWENSDLYEDIATTLGDDTRGIDVEEAKRLFREAYGDNDFTPTEYETVEDGYIIPQFGDGEPVDLVMASQYFEDDDYILLTGPMLYESNGEGEMYEGVADILFAKNPDSRFGATIVYTRLRDVNITISSVETSSELPPSGGKSYSGSNLIDGDPTTVWAEGAAGTGIGETITLHLDKAQPVYGVQMVIGYTASYEQYKNNGMPTDVEVDFGGARAEGHDLEGYGSEGFSPEDLASMNRFVVSLDEPVVTDTVRITITGAKKGEKYDDICMSEVLVYGP